MSPTRSKEELLAEIGILRQENQRLRDDARAANECGYENYASQDYFRGLISAIPDMMWLKDPKGLFLCCNPAFERFYGATEAEILGKTDYDFVDTELADFFRAKDKLAVERDQPSVNEEWITYPDTGQRVLLETVKTPIRKGTGELLGVLGIARDITDRKLAELALEKRLIALTKPTQDVEGVRFEDLFNLEDIQRLQDEFSNATGVAALITRPDGSPLTKPSNFCRLCRDIIRPTPLGQKNCCKSDRALGVLNIEGPSIKHCASGGLWDAGAAIVADNIHVASWLIGQVRDESRGLESIREYARRIGVDEDEAAQAYDEVPSMPFEQFESIAKVLHTLANQLSNIAYQNIQQARFIHMLKSTEKELAKTRNYLSNIFDSMPSLLIGVDTEGRVTQCNTRARLQAGVSREQAIGQPLDLLLPRLGHVLERVRDSIRTRTTTTDSLRFKSKNGGLVHENLTIYPLVANGVDGAVIRIDDVTDRVKLEQMMVQSEKMMSLGGLAAGMAHEINNPLAGVLGYSQNIQKRVFGDLKKNFRVADECGVALEGVRDYLRARQIDVMLDGIRESGARAAAIVTNMLGFSRKSNRQLGFNDLPTILEKTIELISSDYNLSRYYDFKKIDIRRKYAPDTPLAYCDGNEIQQVLLNLLKNAAEAMSEKSYVDESPIISCRIYPRGDMIITEIEDNGPGMSEEVRNRLFEPFYTTKEVGKGTGLGLSVSYFIITDQHHGTLEADSAPGQWTRFTISLPLIKEAPHGTQDTDS